MKEWSALEWVQKYVQTLHYDRDWYVNKNKYIVLWFFFLALFRGTSRYFKF